MGLFIFFSNAKPFVKIGWGRSFKVNSNTIDFLFSFLCYPFGKQESVLLNDSCLVSFFFAINLSLHQPILDWDPLLPCTISSIMAQNPGLLFHTYWRNHIWQFFNGDTKNFSPSLEAMHTMCLSMCKASWLDLYFFPSDLNEKNSPVLKPSVCSAQFSWLQTYLMS